MRLLLLIPFIYIFIVLLYMLIVMSSVTTSADESNTAKEKSLDEMEKRPMNISSDDDNASTETQDNEEEEEILEINPQPGAKRLRIEREFKIAHDRDFYLAHLPRGAGSVSPPVSTAYEWAKQMCQQTLLKFIAYSMDMEVVKIADQLEKLEDNLPLLFFTRVMEEQEGLPDDHVRNRVLKLRQANKLRVTELQYELIKLVRTEHSFIKHVVKDQVFRSFFWDELVVRVSRARNNPLNKAELETLQTKHMTLLKDLAQKVREIVMGKDLPPPKRRLNLAALMEAVKEYRDQLPMF